jgi:class 3 adenylate cyclase
MKRKMVRAPRSAGEAGKGLAYLRRLLSERNQFPDRVDAIDKEIRRTFERKVAILVLDMVGFARLTSEHGIIHYLAMIHQMYEAARPAVIANGGEVIKREADNLYCVFPAPAPAVEAALDIFRAFDAVNSVVPPGRDIYGSIGIGYGETLIIAARDMFGAEMNLACKLGEDLAGKKEILLTESAQNAIPANTYEFDSLAFTISDLHLRAYRLTGKLL